MAKPIGIGVIGMGWMGVTHSKGYIGIPARFEDEDLRPRLVICCDEVDARSKEAQAKLGFAESTIHWSDVVNHPEVQAINIATPNQQHLEIVEAAAAAGKHIFCEKPVGRGPEETARIEYAARKAGVMSFVGYNYRWAPVVQYARQFIQEGKLGDLTHFRGRFHCMYGSNPYSVLSWRFQEEYAGLGTLGDLMSHAVDMALTIAGPIKRLVADRETFIRRRPLSTPGEGTHFTTRMDGPSGAVTNEDYVSLLVEFANGAHGTLEACRVIFGPKVEMAFGVNGTKGAINWDFERMNEMQIYLPDGNENHDGYTRILSDPSFHPGHVPFNPAPGTGLGYDDLKTIEAYHFLRSIVDGVQRSPSFADALAVAEVQAAAQQSWGSGSWTNVVSLKK